MPNRVKNQRHLADYLEQLTAALEPLADHESVSETVSRLLHRWTDLFIHQEGDEENLKGLPELLLQLGAHLFYTDISDHSTVTLLPPLSTPVGHNEGEPLDVVNSSSYFFNAFMVPYLEKQAHAKALMHIAGAKSAYDIYNWFFTAKSIKKSALLTQMENNLNTGWLVGEKLSLEQGQETFLSHILKIGNSKRTIHANTKSYKTYLKLLSRYTITEDKLNQFFSLADFNMNTVTLPTKQAVLSDNEKHTLKMFTRGLINHGQWSWLRCMLDLGAPIESIANELRNSTSNAVATPEKQYYMSLIQKIKSLTDLSHDPVIAQNIKEPAKKYAIRSLRVNGYFGASHSSPYYDDLFQALFQCSLRDIDSLKRLSTTEMILSLFFALANEATHPSRKALRIYYREQLETKLTLPPIIIAIYCASQIRSQKRFFGLTQATFERLLLSESTTPFDFIHLLFVTLSEEDRHYHQEPINQLKDRLIDAIQALSPATQSKLMTMIDENRDCLALALLKTRKRTDATKNTTHYSSLLAKLKQLSASDYRDYDSSDDEAEWQAEPLAINPAQATIVDEYLTESNHAVKAAWLYSLLLDNRLETAQMLIQAAKINLNRDNINWIQLNVHGVNINCEPGNIATKVWTDTTLDEARKIELTTFLVENGFDVHYLFCTIAVLKKLDLPSEALEKHITSLCNAGIVESNFYKTPSTFNDYSFSIASLDLNTDQPRPITLLLCQRRSSSYYYLQNSQVILVHFMQAISPEQIRGVNHYLNRAHRDTVEWIQEKITTLINDSEEAIERFKTLKANKTPCALFPVLKHGRATPYAPSLYTLFKQKVLPKPVPSALLEKEAAEKMRIASK